MTQPASFRWRSGIKQWFRDTLRTRGLFGTIAEIARQAFFLARDYTPTWRRARYGDIDFDFEHGTDTTWANVRLSTRLKEILTRGQYQASEPALFHEILNAVPQDYRGFSFVDMGSGKGRALLMASDYPFRRIIGVEIIPELSAIAAQNAAKYGSESQQCSTIETFCGDARAFPIPPEPEVFYFFNPFPRDVLESVLANIANSLVQSPRKIWVIYHNLVLEDVFANQRWLKKISGTHQYSIYTN